MASDAAQLPSTRRDHSRSSKHHERKSSDSKDKRHSKDYDEKRDDPVRKAISDRISAQKSYRGSGHRFNRNSRSQRGHDGRGRKTDRHFRHDHDHEHRHRRKSRSRSRGRSRQHSKSHSGSPDGRSSKRQSGFDMAPSNGSASPASMPGQLAAGATTAVPGVLPGIFPFAALQYGGLSTVSMQSMTQQATRHARRIYVGGLPLQANEQTIATFFSQVMQAIGGNTAGPGDAVVNVYINHEKKFAFVEMRTVEEASNAMALDGIIFEGVSVRIRRPTDYSPSLAATLGPSQPSPHLNLSAVGLIPGAIGGADGPDRVFVGGLPYYLTDTQIKQLLESFGPLKGFDLVRDQDTGNSKGYGFCVYQDAAVTDVACAALNGLKMGDKTLTVRRATASGQPRPEKVAVFQGQQLAMQVGTTAIASLPNFPGLITALSTGLMPGIMPGVISGMHSSIETSSKVVCLRQVVSLEELKEDNVYEEIFDDMKDECSKYGTLVDIVIPRPSPLGKTVAGVGKVFLHYSDEIEAKKANEALHGRKFGGNTVLAVYYPEEKFLRGEYDN